MRWLAKRVIVGVALVAGVCASSGWLTSAGYDFWRAGEYERELHAHEEASHRLDDTMEGCLHRLAVKEAIVGDYAAGRVTFAEAVAQFRRLNESNDEIMTALHDRYAGRDDAEIAAYNAVLFIQGSVPKFSPVRAKLHKDFRALYPHADPRRL